MSWVAYVTPMPFPWGQAGSRRIYGVARAMAISGTRVVVASGESEPSAPKVLETFSGGGEIVYQGVGESPAAGATPIQKAIRVFGTWGRRTAEWLEKQPQKPSHVIVYGGGTPYMLRLLSWCRKNDVKLIADVVEWYDPRQLTGGRFGPFNISAKIALRLLYPKCDGVIAISKLLSDYYKDRGCHVITVPPIVDVLSFKSDVCVVNEGGPLRLVYAGTPGNKDSLGEVIAAISELDPAGDLLELIILGPSEEIVRSMSPSGVLPKGVNVVGKVHQSEVGVFVRSADFSVLLREPARFSNAGFPTKFVESLANGVPVIANITSDLGEYLHDMEEGLICEAPSSLAFASVLRRALAVSRKDMHEMRGRARSRALYSFDSGIYADRVSSFLRAL